MANHPRNVRWALRAAGAFFLLYVGNVLLGKLAVMQGVLEGWQAGNVVEALVLFLAVIAFVVAAIQRESDRAADQSGRPAQNSNPVGGNDDQVPRQREP